jgi:uncharacterized protein
VSFLVATGANIDLQNDEEQSALMLSSRWGHDEIARILIAAGANIHLADEAGNTALLLSM